MPKKPTPSRPTPAPPAGSGLRHMGDIAPPRDLSRGGSPAHPTHGGHHAKGVQPLGLVRPAAFKPQDPRQMHGFDDKHPRDKEGRFEPKVRK